MKIFLDWLTLVRIGLILNTVGAIVLIIGSDKIVDVLKKFIDAITPTFGTYAQGYAIPRIKELELEFNAAKKISKRYNIAGYILFIIGFILQLF